MTRILIFMVLAAAMATTSCSSPGEFSRDTSSQSSSKLSEITPQQWNELSSRTIYFGHQSVGFNILDGVRSVLSDYPQVRLNIVDGPKAGSGPGLVQFQIGENGDPASKTKAFLRNVMDLNTGHPVLMWKYCYVDITQATDVAAVFEQYRTAVEELRRMRPNATIVHITMPLTTGEPAWRYYYLKLRGLYTHRELNGKRNLYNELLLKHYGASDPTFDLAAIESTRADGSRQFFRNGGKRVYTLAPEWASGRGHLNEAGSRHVAEQFLIRLATLGDNQISSAR